MILFNKGLGQDTDILEGNFYTAFGTCSMHYCTVVHDNMGQARKDSDQLILIVITVSETSEYTIQCVQCENCV